MNQNYLLNLMGIEVWQSRYGTAIGEENYTLLSDAKPSGRLLLEKLGYPSENEAQVMNLLDAMLSAIKLKRSSDVHPASSAFELIMGEQLAQQYLNTHQSLDEMRATNPHQRDGVQIVVTYHPWNLLQEPENKRKAWEDLKKTLP